MRQFLLAAVLAAATHALVTPSARGAAARRQRISMEDQPERLDLGVGTGRYMGRPVPPPFSRAGRLAFPPVTLTHAGATVEYCAGDECGGAYKPFAAWTFETTVREYVAAIPAVALAAIMRGCVWTQDILTFDDWHRGRGTDFEWIWRLACVALNVRPYQEYMNWTFSQWARETGFPEYFNALNVFGKTIGIPNWVTRNPGANPLVCGVCGKALVTGVDLGDDRLRHWDHSSGTSHVNGPACPDCNTKSCMLLQRVGPVECRAAIAVRGVAHVYTAHSATLTDPAQRALEAGLEELEREEAEAEEA